MAAHRLDGAARAHPMSGVSEAVESGGHRAVRGLDRGVLDVVAGETGAGGRLDERAILDVESGGHRGARWLKRRPRTSSAIRLRRISVEPPAIIQPLVRRKQYSTSVSTL